MKEKLLKILLSPWVQLGVVAVIFLAAALQLPKAALAIGSTVNNALHTVGEEQQEETSHLPPSEPDLSSEESSEGYFGNWNEFSDFYEESGVISVGRPDPPPSSEESSEESSEPTTEPSVDPSDPTASEPGTSGEESSSSPEGSEPGEGPGNTDPSQPPVESSAPSSEPGSDINEGVSGPGDIPIGPIPDHPVASEPGSEPSQPAGPADPGPTGPSAPVIE